MKGRHLLSGRRRGGGAFSGFSVPAAYRAVMVTLLAIGLSVESFAQDGSVDQAASAPSVGRRGVTIVPRVTVTEILTDNANLSNTAKQADLVTEVIPGIRVTSDFGRVKGYFDYSLNGRVSAQGVSGTSLQNNLTAFGSLEAVENFAFLDVNASITQQSVSGLGTQSSGSYFSNANQTETSTYRISPYLKGSVGGYADFETRYGFAFTRSASSVASDVTTKDLLLSLKGQPSASRIGWSLQAVQQATSYSLGRATESDSLTGSLSYALNPQLVVSASAGQEGNNYNTLEKERNWTNGQGIQWSPSPSTSFSASRQTRPFGQSHNINLSYRTARSAWSFTDSQDVSNSPSQSSLGSLGPIYDLYFTQFATVEPDPVKRAVLVNTFLQVNGINPNTIVVSNFLTSALSLQRRQDLSFTLLGIRSSVTFTATRTETSRLDTITNAIDDLSNSNSIRQTGLSVSYAHRLTPDTSMNVTGMNQRSSDSSGIQETVTNSVNLGVSTRLGLKSTAAINARRVVFDNRTSPYIETAITGTVTVQF